MPLTETDLRPFDHDQRRLYCYLLKRRKSQPGKGPKTSQCGAFARSANEAMRSSSENPACPSSRLPPRPPRPAPAGSSVRLVRSSGITHPRGGVFKSTVHHRLASNRLFPGAIGRRYRDPRRGLLRLCRCICARIRPRRVNDGAARGGSIDTGGPVVVNGKVFVNSGYGQWGGTPGNVLLTFSVDGR